MSEEWRKANLLIWGKTYPEFSRKYYETVCTGGVDRDTGRLVRLYPITMRHQKQPLKTYDWISARIQRNPSDRRPESFRVQQEEIEVTGHVDTGHGWAERSRWILAAGNIASSVEELKASQRQHGTSLALVKPKEVLEIYSKKLPPSERSEWELKRTEAVKQKDLFVEADATTKELAFMPIRYRIRFTCNGRHCRQHDMQVLDWGVYALSRKMYADKGSSALAERDVIGKLREYLDPKRKDAYLFLGNTLAHPQSFMIVGFYHPPKEAQIRMPGLD